MTRECEVCGATLRTGRKYCWRHRYAGKENYGTSSGGGDIILTLIKRIALYIIAVLPFILLYFGYYQITLGKIGFGILLLIFGALFWWRTISSKKQRERFNDRILWTKTDLSNLDNEPDKFGVTAFWIGIAVFLIIMFFVIPPTKWTVFNHGELKLIVNDSGINNVQDNFSLNQESSYPEEELINLCISKFSGAGIFDLKKTNYQDDFSSASDWIRENYENSALTQEQKETNINYIINNQLPKEDYPIVITLASKKDGQITSTGFYYCNESGVI